MVYRYKENNMAQMTKRERLSATINGQEVDRIAVALWRHFPGDDQRPADLAESQLTWQAQYDWDFIKVSPASSFRVVDWGIQTRGRAAMRDRVSTPNGRHQAGRLGRVAAARPYGGHTAASSAAWN